MSATMDQLALIKRAFVEAQSRRPYAASKCLVDIVCPPGGDWRCVVANGSICRTIEWGSKEVALVNPRGDLDDVTEGQIAMAMRALPALDAAMRIILVLAESADNLATIRSIAESLLAYGEMPAPAIPSDEPEETDEDDTEGYEL